MSFQLNWRCNRNLNTPLAIIAVFSGLLGWRRRLYFVSSHIIARAVAQLWCYSCFIDRAISMVASEPVLNNLFMNAFYCSCSAQSNSHCSFNCWNFSSWICYTTYWKWPRAPSWCHDAVRTGPICTWSLFQSKALAIQVICSLAQKR